PISWPPGARGAARSPPRARGRNWGRGDGLDLPSARHLPRGGRGAARAPGGHEMGVAGLAIIGPSPIDYPIQPKEHGIDFLLDHRHFWLRTPRQVAIM